MCRCEWWGALQFVGWLVWLAHLLLPAKVECPRCLPDVMLCVYGHVVKCHQEVASGQVASKWRPGRGVQYNGAATPGVGRQQAPMEPPQHGGNGQAQHLEDHHSQSVRQCSGGGARAFCGALTYNIVPHASAVDPQLDERRLGFQFPIRAYKRRREAPKQHQPYRVNTYAITGCGQSVT